MADEATTGADDLKEAVEKLKPLLEALGSADPPDAKAAPAAVIDDLYGAISSAEVTSYAEQAAAAVDRYRSAMRWLVGAVAAVGAILFGSTAFIDASWDDNKVPFAWLLVAALGLVILLRSATLVFEPVDASLGELDRDIGRFLATRAANGDLIPAQTRPDKHLFWYRIFSPREAARRELAIILSADPDAHLGPDMHSVSQMIHFIGHAQKTRRHQAKLLDRLRTEQSAEATALHLMETSIGAHEGLATALKDGGPNTATQELEVQLKFLLAQAGYRRGRADVLALEAAKADGELLSYDFDLGVIMLHRDLLLYEAAVSELRGIFHHSRRLLFFGAALTLLGATLYIATAKSGSDDDGGKTVVRSGTLIVTDDTPAADPFPNGCVTAEAGTEPSEPVLMSVFVFEKDTPGLDDEFDVTVTEATTSDPELCNGTFTIPAGRGEGDVVLDLGPAAEVPTGDISADTADD